MLALTWDTLRWLWGEREQGEARITLRFGDGSAQDYVLSPREVPSIVEINDTLHAMDNYTANLTDWTQDSDNTP